MITKVINVNLHQPIYEKLTAKQGDIASRYLLFHLLDGDKPFDLTGKSVRVYARKPDKTEIFNDLIINDKTKGYCTLELTSQCLASAGIVKMELYISQSSKVLTSIPFDLEVISCINTANSVVSTNEFTALTNGLASLLEYDNYKEELNSVKLNKASLIELEVERKRIDSLIAQGNGVDNAETADIRVSASGLKYTSAGDSVRETQKGNAILDNTITPRHLSTMKTLNLFNGQYIQGKYIGGNIVGNMTLSSNSNYFLIAMDVEPSTTYSVFYGNDVGVEDGNYWFKIASSTKRKNEVLSLSDAGSYSFDGSIAFLNTSSSYQAGQRITTSATDKSLFILVSKYTKPNYFEVIKGSRSSKMYSNYEDSYKFYNKFIPKSLVKKNGNEMTIYLKSKINENFVYIIFKRQTDTNRKLDTWRIYEIGICNYKFDKLSILQTDTDQEGAIEENGASDFIGGFHGDEYYNKIQIVIDGVVYSENDYIMLKDFNNIKIYVSSILNHCNTTNKAFDRVKILEFSNEGYYTIENNLTCASSFLIKRLATALFSIDKQYNYNNLIQYYNENLTNYPTIVPMVNNNSTTLVWDNSITEIELYGNGLYTKTSLLTEKLNGYMGMIQDFGGRIKAYLDPARNLQMNIGDKIKTKFKVEIRC